MKIICDTNVWYNFALYGIEPFSPYLENTQLCMTNLSYFEMLSSKRVFNFGLAQRVQRAISEVHATMIIAPDILYVMRELGVECECPNDVVVSKRDFDQFYERFKNSSSFWQLGYRQHWAVFSRKIHTQIWACNTNHKIRNLAKKEQKLSLDYFKGLVIDLLKLDMELYVGRHKIKIINSPSKDKLEQNLYAKFQCYIEAFSGYLYESYKLNIKSKFKIKANDYMDFRNLLYCTDGCRYLTFEKNTKMGVAKMLKTYAPQFVIEHMEDIRNISLEQQMQLDDTMTKETNRKMFL